MNMNDLDYYIEEISNKVNNEINIFQKIILFITQKSSIHHWGLCLYIRNNYIYNNEELMNMNIDPDELSDKILKRVINRKWRKSNVHKNRYEKNYKNNKR